MNINCITVLCSLSSGIIIGLGYGFSFLLARGRIFSYANNNGFVQIFLNQTAQTFLRMTLFALAFWYLLRLPIINFILLLGSFFITFWILVFNRKA